MSAGEMADLSSPRFSILGFALAVGFNNIGIDLLMPSKIRL